MIRSDSILVIRSPHPSPIECHDPSSLIEVSLTWNDVITTTVLRRGRSLMAARNATVVDGDFTQLKRVFVNIISAVAAAAMMWRYINNLREMMVSETVCVLSSSDFSTIVTAWPECIQARLCYCDPRGRSLYCVGPNIVVVVAVAVPVDDDGTVVGTLVDSNILFCTNSLLCLKIDDSFCELQFTFAFAFELSQTSVRIFHL